MHEASLCDALFDQVDAAIRPHPGARVRMIHVALGELAGVDAELFTIAFDTLRADRHAGARLVLNHVAALWQCRSCNHSRRPGAPLACPTCNTPLELAAGADLTLLRIELELPTEGDDDHV